MKRSASFISKALILCTISFMVYLAGCTKTENPIKYPTGTFPDSVYNLAGINSVNDDYNSNLPVIGSSIPIIFSSNRGSSGGQFDLVQGTLWFQFDQHSGAFSVGSEMASDAFYAAIISKAITTSNDYGPYSIFSSTDGYEYFMYANDATDNQLDIYYLKYLPRYGTNIPDISGPYPARLINSVGNDAYISFDANEDSVYFSSDRGGNYDIYLHKKTAGLMMDSWLNQNFAASTLVDSINSSADDRCPFVYKNMMVFASNRDGGIGKYDLYYSVFKNGKWNSPVNFGPRINSSENEFRPLTGYHPQFNNRMMIFSSDRAGGKGGFDLYFTGIAVPK
jgi:hypothetical protein